MHPNRRPAKASQVEAASPRRNPSLVAVGRVRCLRAGGGLDPGGGDDLLAIARTAVRKEKHEARRVAPWIDVPVRVRLEPRDRGTLQRPLHVLRRQQPAKQCASTDFPCESVDILQGRSQRRQARHYCFWSAFELNTLQRVDGYMGPPRSTWVSIRSIDEVQNDILGVLQEISQRPGF